MNSLDLLDRLIAFPTVSRNPNLDLVGWVKAFLAERGIAATLVPSADGTKANLFATIGPADRPGVLLAGHTDVVPVEGQAWTLDPFRLTARGARYHGRGTADMKGFVACALRAADLASRRVLAAPLHLALSYDEEIGCVGVRPLLDRLAAAPFQARCAIMGEPTEMAIGLGHKGKLAARAECCGVAGHSALAPQALNAIHLAAELIGGLRALQDRLAAEGPFDTAYTVPYGTIHVGRIAGGEALNIVPARTSLELEIRPLAGQDAGALYREIEAMAERIAAPHRPRFPQAAIRLETVNAYPGLETPPEAEVVGFLAALLESRGTTKLAFGTEGGLYRTRLGIPVAVCGPGSMQQGHKPDEFVTADQLAACDRMMDRLVDALAA